MAARRHSMSHSCGVPHQRDCGGTRFGCRRRAIGLFPMLDRAVAPLNEQIRMGLGMREPISIVGWQLAKSRADILFSDGLHSATPWHRDAGCETAAPAARLLRLVRSIRRSPSSAGRCRAPRRASVIANITDGSIRLIGNPALALRGLWLPDHHERRVMDLSANRPWVVANILRLLTPAENSRS